MRYDKFVVACAWQGNKHIKSYPSKGISKHLFKPTDPNMPSSGYSDIVAFCIAFNLTFVFFFDLTYRLSLKN